MIKIGGTRRRYVPPTKRFARFVVNYIRYRFDENDDGAQLAYFELLDNADSEISLMVRAFKQRKRWAASYSKFIEQLERTLELMGES